LLVQQAKVGLEVIGILGVADRQTLRDRKRPLRVLTPSRLIAADRLAYGKAHHRWQRHRASIVVALQFWRLDDERDSPRNGNDPASGTLESKLACLDWITSTTISTGSRPLSMVRNTGWNDGTVKGRLGSRPSAPRSEEHTSELQSLTHIVC